MGDVQDALSCLPLGALGLRQVSAEVGTVPGADGSPSHPAVQRTVLAEEELLLDRLRDIRKVSVCGHCPRGAAGLCVKEGPHVPLAGS